MNNSLTKQDVARRQLVTAIRLFFDNADLISVFSLAANAWEVIDVLCSKANVDSISNQTRENVAKGKDLKYDYINSPYRNFFKHADRDPEATLSDFNESNVDSIIFLGVEDYIRLYNKSPIEFQVFQLWYLATNHNKVSGDSLDEMFQSINTAFPDIESLARKEQLLLGRKVLIKAINDTDIIEDKRTEVAF